MGLKLVLKHSLETYLEFVKQKCVCHLYPYVLLPFIVICFIVVFFFFLFNIRGLLYLKIKNIAERRTTQFDYQETFRIYLY